MGIWIFIRGGTSGHLCDSRQSSPNFTAPRPNPASLPEQTTAAFPCAQGRAELSPAKHPPRFGVHRRGSPASRPGHPRTTFSRWRLPSWKAMEKSPELEFSVFGT